ncbi:acyl-CoA dehydrogenase [Actinokineospora sp. NBRC 105648]|uniref:acyl-CoA dehydrogenase n=1 Tax=Actinokineospora sp. NBRC 105648 TaxID=3032206 RepID=UPI0024A58A65|nr:acyl-CoA dehydrogenase [Actinokineospora sp. NBRC 105648]GLZ42870.1 putative acyl-CoA dehydrogenase FadE [Actinokineospora sp. NBRC 105648]
MRFAPTAEQSDLRAVVRDLVRELCPPAVVRAAPDSAEVATLRAGLIELGAPGLLVPEAAGGLGLDENYLVGMMIETGWAAVPLPVVDTFAFAPGVLAVADLTGDRFCGADPDARGTVHYGHNVDLVLTGGFAGTGTIQVTAASGGASVAAVDPAADLLRVTAGPVLATVDDPEVVATAWLRGVLGAAAQLIGLCRRMLDLTVAYVAARKQFGVPIGSFQAVKHHLATALLALEFAEPAVARAGYALAAGEPDRARAVSTAKALASDAAATVARAAIQCHGAIAYTTEYDLHLYAKRAWALAAEWGSAGWHRAAVARELLSTERES